MDAGLPAHNPAGVSGPDLRDAAGGAVREHLLGVHLLLCVPSRPAAAGCKRGVVLVRPLILYQLLAYGPREFPSLPRRVFYAVFFLALAAAFGAVLSITVEFGDFDGAYSAFGQNLMMSVLFLSMLYSRRSLRGQSVSIALLKMAGTALASFAFYF